MQPGKRNSITDVAGFRVGNATDQAIKTGSTVLLGSEPFCAAVHVMGGAPGTRETDLLAPDRLVQKVDAIVLSGGSAFGLDAASGVMNVLAKQGRGYMVEDKNIPIVPAAILFDLLNGGDKNWNVNPYGQFGMAALENACESFQIGSVGAGTGAQTHGLKGGLGTASLITDSGYTVGAVVAVNALGSVVQGETPYFWAAPFEVNGEFGNLGVSAGGPCSLDTERNDWGNKQGANTTIGIVATDADMNQSELTRLAVAAHDGLARAIVPSHTLFDGDLMFAASNGQKNMENREAILFELGAGVAVCVSRAIARGVYEATSDSSDTLPTWKDKFAAI